MNVSLVERKKNYIKKSEKIETFPVQDHYKNSFECRLLRILRPKLCQFKAAYLILHFISHASCSIDVCLLLTIDIYVSHQSNLNIKVIE